MYVSMYQASVESSLPSIDRLLQRRHAARAATERVEVVSSPIDHHPDRHVCCQTAHDVIPRASQPRFKLEPPVYCNVLLYHREVVD